LYYSLAIHMRLSLGAWPRSIGEHGFPSGLLIHEKVTMGYFAGLLVVTVFGWPIAYVVSLLVRPWRRCAFYLGLHVVALIISTLIMLLAPFAFQEWWWD